MKKSKDGMMTKAILIKDGIIYINEEQLKKELGPLYQRFLDAARIE